MFKLIDETIKKVINPKVELTLVLGDLKFTAKTNTFPEAMQKLYEDSFGNVKVWGTLTLKMGGKKAEVKYRPIMLKRAFVGKFAQNMLYDRLLTILK